MILLKQLNISKMMRSWTLSILTMKMWNLQRCNVKLSEINNSEASGEPLQQPLTIVWPQRLEVQTKIQTSLAIADEISNSELWVVVVSLLLFHEYVMANYGCVQILLFYRKKKAWFLNITIVNKTRLNRTHNIHKFVLARFCFRIVLRNTLEQIIYHLKME